MRDKLNIKLDIDDSFFEEEVRCDHLVSKEMKEIWAVELDLLNELLTVCKKHNLRIYGDGGTVLGAVRHKGFIPWDDDIDMVMLREDYDKLCEIAEQEFKHPYFFQTEFTDPGSVRGHAQLRNSTTTAMLKSDYENQLKFNQGIFIDIFPLDAIPDDDKEMMEFLQNKIPLENKYMRFAWCTTRYKKGRNPIKNVIRRMCGKRWMKKYGYNKFFEDFEKYERTYNNVGAKRVTKIFFRYTENKIWERKWFDEIEMLPFEMLELPTPIGREELLNTFFGDWRTPKKILTTHGGVIFDTRKPYTEYINK